MTLVIDPVCSQQFDSTDAVAQSQYQGKTYYFDATECQERFEEDPARYANTPTGDQGRVTHAVGDRNTSIAGHTPHTVVGGPDYDNERMQDRAPGRKPGSKQIPLGDSSSSEGKQPRHYQYTLHDACLSESDLHCSRVIRMCARSIAALTSFCYQSVSNLVLHKTPHTCIMAT